LFFYRREQRELRAEALLFWREEGASAVALAGARRGRDFLTQMSRRRHGGHRAVSLMFIQNRTERMKDERQVGLAAKGAKSTGLFPRDFK